MPTHYNNTGRLNKLYLYAYLTLAMTLSASYPALVMAQCGQGQGKGTDISACTDEILAEQERTLDLLDQMNQTMGTAGIVSAKQQNNTDRQIGFLRKGHDRGRKQKGDTTSEEFDSLVEIGKPSNCEFRLLPRYDQGPPPRTICSDDQISANQCEQVCEYNDKQKARNGNRGIRLEEDLADALEQNRIANDELASNMTAVATLSVQADTANGSCAFNNPHPNLAPVPTASLIFHTEILVLQETITDIGKNGCQQDVLGNNVSTACIALDVLLGVQKGITALVTTIDGNYTSAKVDAIFDCVDTLKANSDGQAVQMDAIESKLDAVTNDVAELKVLLNDVKTQLSTPQGQRDGFPAK